MKQLHVCGTELPTVAGAVSPAGLGKLGRSRASRSRQAGPGHREKPTREQARKLPYDPHGLKILSLPVCVTLPFLLNRGSFCDLQQTDCLQPFATPFAITGHILRSEGWKFFAYARS